MAFPVTPILTKTFSYWQGDWTYSIYDENDDPGAGNENELLIIKGKGLNQIQGSSRLDPKKYIHPTQEHFTILDENGYLYDKLKNAISTQFRLDIRLNGVLKNRLNLLTELNETPKDGFHPEVPILAFDGLTNLKAIDYDKTGLKTLNQFFTEVFEKTGHGIPFELFFDLKHYQATGAYLPNITRIPVDAVLSNEKRRTYYNVLEAVLNRFELHLFQANGVWMIQQINLKNAERNIYGKTYASIPEQTYTNLFDPVVNLDGKIAKNSFDTFIKSSGLVNIVDRFKESLSGGVVNSSFSSWNAGDSEPDNWDLQSGVVEPVSIGPDAGLKSEGPCVLYQLCSRLLLDGQIIHLDINVDIHDTGVDDDNFILPVAEIKLIDIEGGDDYWIKNTGAGLAVENTSGYFNAYINTIPGPQNHNLLINEDVVIPAGFIGYLELYIRTTNTSFDPDSDSIDEFDSFEYNELNITLVSTDNGLVPSINYFKEVKSNASEFDLGICDYYGHNYEDCIQFLLDTYWQQAYNWDTSGATTQTISDRKADIMLSYLSLPANGLKLKLDREQVDINLSNSLYEDGVYYNPYYIVYDKINDSIQAHLIELNNDVTIPNKSFNYIER